MKRLLMYAAAAGILLVIFGTIYATTQQVLRQSANDPQIQIASDTAALLNLGYDVQGVSLGYVDLSRSLAPFTVIYGKDGKAVAGSGYLDNELAVIPVEVLKHADGNPYHAVTWQPKDDLRFAAVAVAANDYYVLTARSLREVEPREQKVMLMSALGLGVSLFVLAMIFVLRRRSQPTVS